MFRKSPVFEPFLNRTVSSIEESLSELEDTYADCLKDEVDYRTLNQIWSRIKLLRSAEGTNEEMHEN